MKVVTGELVAQVSAEAVQNSRKRKNFNIHPSDDSRCHRLLNAIEPDSYIRPHRHLDPEKDEAFILIRGRLGIVTFSDDGSVAGTLLLSHDNGNLAADIPHGVYHTALSLETGTVVYETKAGPFRQLADEEKGMWAPEDGTPRAQEYLEQLRRMFF